MNRGKYEICPRASKQLMWGDHGFDDIDTKTRPSYAPLMMRVSSNRMHRTSSSWPSKMRKHAPHSTSHNLCNKNSNWMKRFDRESIYKQWMHSKPSGQVRNSSSSCSNKDFINLFKDICNKRAEIMFGVLLSDEASNNLPMLCKSITDWTWRLV